MNPDKAFFEVSTAGVLWLLIWHQHGMCILATALSLASV